VVNDIVIVGGVRTPIGSHGGGPRDVKPQELAKIVMVEALGRLVFWRVRARSNASSSPQTYSERRTCSWTPRPGAWCYGLADTPMRRTAGCGASSVA